MSHLGPEGLPPVPEQPGDPVRDPQPQHAAGRSARGRLLDSLRRPSRSQLTGAVLVGVLGFATVTQVHARQADDPYAGLRTADLVQVLNGLNAQSRRAQTEIDQLEATRSQLTDRSQQRQAALAQARQQNTNLGILAGTLAARGPGVRITVDDPEGKLSLNNLLDAIEELRAAGAEAMEFNDSVRVVAQTAFEQADGGIRVNNKTVDPPYVLDAVGNPDTLAAALDFADGFSSDVRANGGSVTVDKLKQVTVSSVVKAGSTQFATPSQ